jgi:pyruvate dehydrogenase E1 component beta subunit
VKRRGEDLTVVSLGVGLHRALQAAEDLSHQGVEAEVIDLRTVSPLDGETVAASAARTGKVLVVDEDYTAFGLSGEIAAVLAEAGVRVGFKRVGTDVSIPYARRLEERVLPGKDRILAAAMDLLG